MCVCGPGIAGVAGDDCVNSIFYVGHDYLHFALCGCVGPCLLYVNIIFCDICHV